MSRVFIAEAFISSSSDTSETRTKFAPPISSTSFSPRMLKSYNSSRLWLTDLLSNSSGLLLDEGILGDTLFSGDLTNSNGSTTTDEETPINCVAASINEFPNDFFTDDQRSKGGFLVHGVIVAYVCAMLAIVCDRYFVPSLKVICKHFNVPSDIAGATFMAVGASSPELFSSVIGAFVAKGDIGIGTVVGSAVFNILGVTGASGLALGTLAVQLEWYPITRDCFVYIVTVSSLVIVIHDNLVTWIEATSLLVMFVGYIAILYFNNSVRRFAMRTVKAAKHVWSKDGDFRLHAAHKLFNEKSPLLSVTVDGKATVECRDDDCPRDCNRRASMFRADSSSSSGNTFSETDDDDASQSKTTYGIFDCEKISNKQEEDEMVASAQFSLFNAPTESKTQTITWILMWPANALFRITIPNCASERNLKWFPLTFLSSIIWLGILSYISFWMVAYIAYTFGIPDTVAGITILAAGTSIPELVASIIVVKNGMANMAISNLIGSNIFDILFCLGLPWLVKTMLNPETHSFVINSSALTYTTLILLSNVVLFYICLLVCRWKLGLRVGVSALCLYAAFLVLASMYESNVFGDFNPPTCPTL